ncbi:hypothetical protein J2W22_000031 [Sphingomonas kyeonggiensis]|uniref:hypothetical protein n=1 Tax=Sphingomonas kyeonggiensis TaxID=1268553 RepID=UPI0027812224|nr:hypothetical protein [Sphingomonas kyeonggiensis]MDQ0247984.1 hypothetical protein [Sphingomonas kyeonggiensis]
MFLAAALLLVQTAPATQTTACKATDASLPTGLLGWVKPGDEFTPGKAVELDTIDAAALKGLPAGSKPGKAATIGFKIETPGTYGIALDQGGWIDVLPGGRRRCGADVGQARPRPRMLEHPQDRPLRSQAGPLPALRLGPARRQGEGDAGRRGVGETGSPQLTSSPRPCAGVH